MPRHPGALNVRQEPLLGGVTGLEEAGDPADKFQVFSTSMLSSTL